MRFATHVHFVRDGLRRIGRAAGYTAEDIEQSASVQVTRAAGAGVVPSVVLKVADPGEGPTPVGALHLHAGGHDLGALGPRDDDDAYVLNATQQQAVLNAVLRTGPLSLVDRNQQTWTISDRGATAVLLKMDDVQGRVGTVGALLRKGNKDESAVLPALPAPQVARGAIAPPRAGDSAIARSPALLAAVRSALKPLAETCWRADETPISADELQVHRLTDTTLLVSAPCWMAAYNNADAYWTTPDTAPYTLTLVTTDANDYADGELSASHKGRGIGDCWSQQSWLWNGNAFVETSQSTTGWCRGQPGGFWTQPTVVTQTR